MLTGSHREFWLVLLRSTHTDETISIATAGFFKGEIGERCENPKRTLLKTVMGRSCWYVCRGSCIASHPGEVPCLGVFVWDLMAWQP